MKRIDELVNHIADCNEKGLSPEKWLPELMVEIAVSLARICDVIEQEKTVNGISDETAREGDTA